MAKKRKHPMTDGLGPREKETIRNALRLVWQRSHAWRLVKKRCTDKAGFPKCEKCKKRVPAVKVDHVAPIGEVGPGFIERLMVPSKLLCGLCKDCHNAKTKMENAMKRDFF